MTPSPQHGTPAGDASIAIRRLARQAGGDVQELMTLYALEGLLARIALSEHRDDFVLYADDGVMPTPWRRCRVAGCPGIMKPA